jgi:hypothetical protein
MYKALLTTAVDASAIFPAVVVVKIPVGINMTKPPFCKTGEVVFIVAIAVVPDIKTTGVETEIVVAEAIVGAAPKEDKGQASPLII